VADDARDDNPQEYQSAVDQVLQPSNIPLITSGPLPDLNVGLLPA
jgi:hypothetical protein